ncbi:hypothetical protein [Nocardia sp. NPDC051832]|uniref:hypothetical protein n=1 Tax=Nocardia sp. NPDC051832 TaxID=3155673 RepID=UPI0034360CC2
MDAWFLSKDAIKEALAAGIGNAVDVPELGGIAHQWQLSIETGNVWPRNGTTGRPRRTAPGRLNLAGEVCAARRM